MAPLFANLSPSASFGPGLTVWLLILGCHILVSNFMTGDLKGYMSGIWMSTVYVPPA